MKPNPISFDKLLKGIKKIPWFFGLHAFWFILLFVSVDLLIGGFVFYKYAFLAKNQELNTSGIVVEFDKRAYRAVLQELQRREELEPTLPAESLLDSGASQNLDQ